MILTRSNYRTFKYKKKPIFIVKPHFGVVAMKTEKLDLSKRIERRLEMIYAHTKQGKTVRCVIEEFSVSVGTYYYWYHRYEKEGVFGLLNSILKRVPKLLIIKPVTMLHPSSLRLLITIQS